MSLFIAMCFVAPQYLPDYVTVVGVGVVKHADL
jgi:hypothetical protein